ncbi:hypothetical protein AAZX31_08G095100 [Glycine max]|uniref:Uncharacterized protein n=1 Tax=Glycine max TaxID=3847 RepID=K7L5S8_SOYBN|nr:hypothetical protein GYH30_020768 [Glycine max]KRH42562.1 hypothetical protein GLYMA_08G097500v4 [Glycine max]
MPNPPCLAEDSIKYYKPKDHTQKTKGFSIFASVLSLIIYISLFYIFNISPYTLLNNYIFWFFLSNNIILIIAVDSGVFSSLEQEQDPYEQYHVSNYQQVDDKKCINPKMGGEMVQEINKYTITENNTVPECVIEVVVQNELPKEISEGYSNNVKRPLLPLEVHDSDRACKEKHVPARFKCDRPHRIKRVNDESMKRRRSATTKIEAEVDEENEFNSMTNEELNRRVEEFIQKCRLDFRQ